MEPFETKLRSGPQSVLADIMDVGFACAYLATPYARRISGETLYVDGGVHIMACDTDACGERVRQSGHVPTKHRRFAYDLAIECDYAELELRCDEPISLLDP